MNSYISNILLFVALIIFTACSSENKSQKQENDSIIDSLNNQNLDTTRVIIQLADTTKVNTPVGFYDSWEKAQFENIKIIYPADHPFSDEMNDYAQLFKAVLRRNAQFFKLPEPTNEITMYYYTGFGQGQDLANSEFPTTRGDSIYYWSGNKFGITAAMHALNRWTKIKSRYKFLNQGIMRLLDATGRNYHEMTLSFIDSSKFKTFDDLLGDIRINYHAEAYQTAEAASFIDYFVYKYGIDNFRLLYESQLPFDSTVQSICKMDKKTLENDWIQVVTQAIRKK